MTTIKIQNLKCGGCAHTITKAIQNIEGVSEVNVDVELSTVSFQTISFEKWSW
jgi:copper chaperone CopZ